MKNRSLFIALVLSIMMVCISACVPAGQNAIPTTAPSPLPSPTTAPSPSPSPSAVPSVTALPTITPAPKPSPTPTRQAVVYPSGGMKGWKTYTNAGYGFSVQYPENWTLKEVTDPIATMKGHAIQLVPQANPKVMLQIGFKRSSEEQQITRTGVGSGDIITRGAVVFLGKEIQRDVLVALGKDMTVLYKEPNSGTVKRGNLEFSLYLDYMGQVTDEAALKEDIENVADLIVASMQGN